MPKPIPPSVEAKKRSMSLQMKQRKVMEAQERQKKMEVFEGELSSKIILYSKEVRYEIVKQIAKKQFGWKCTRFKPDKESGSEALTHARADWDIMWMDSDFTIDRLKGLKPYQKINHFPGMTVISLKNNLAKYLKLMAKQLPEDFIFFPKTWSFPAESYDLMNFV